MEEQKNISKRKVTNEVKWIIFVIIMLIVIVTSAIIVGINHNKNKKVQETLANAEVEDLPETIKQEELVDTSKMTQEELKKLNEEEVKKAEEKQNNKNKNQNKATKPVKNKYYIKVNYGAQTVTVYTYDKKGNYTVPVKAFVCSTGEATPTSGVYKISWKAVWGKLFGNVWGHYCTQIVGDILFHSVPYMQAKNDTLVTAYYDRLGTKDSMGCIRLTTIDAQWIYNNCQSGTQVEFYSSSNPGPLGKPTAKKISNAPGKLKRWDPTDPAPNNPWRTYKPQKDENKNTTTNNIINNTIDTNNTVTNTITNNTTNTIENNVITNNITNNEIVNNTVNNTETNNTNDITNNVVSNTENNNQNQVIENTNNTQVNNIK